MLKEPVLISSSSGTKVSFFSLKDSCDQPPLPLHNTKGVPARCLAFICVQKELGSSTWDSGRGVPQGLGGAGDRSRGSPAGQHHSSPAVPHPHPDLSPWGPGGAFGNHPRDSSPVLPPAPSLSPAGTHPEPHTRAKHPQGPLSSSGPPPWGWGPSWKGDCTHLD